MTSSSSSSSPPTERSRGEAPGDEPSLLDLSGEICPFTFVRAKLALEELPIGATLRVVVDHAPAVRNLPRSATEWGQEVLSVTPVPEAPADRPRWAIDLRKRVR